MDLESIYALMERFERSTLTGLELEQNGTRLKLDRRPGGGRSQPGRGPRSFRRARCSASSGERG